MQASVPITCPPLPWTFIPTLPDIPQWTYHPPPRHTHTHTWQAHSFFGHTPTPLDIPPPPPPGHTSSPTPGHNPSSPKGPATIDTHPIPPLVNRHLWKHYTFPQLRWRAVTKASRLFCVVVRLYSAAPVKQTSSSPGTCDGPRRTPSSLTTVTSASSRTVASFLTSCSTLRMTFNLVRHRSQRNPSGYDAASYLHRKLLSL